MVTAYHGGAEMKTLRKHLALLTAAALLCTGVSGSPHTLRFCDAAAVNSSVTAFAERISEQLRTHSSEKGFAQIRFSAQEQQLFCDGKAMGERVQGYCIVDGELMVSSALTETAQQRRSHTSEDTFLSLDEAAGLIGCTAEQRGDDLILTSPFHSARLLVTAEQPFDTRNAVWVENGYRNVSVVQYETAADAYAAYLCYESDPAIISVEPDQMFSAAASEYSDAADAEYTAFGPADRWGLEAIGADAYCAWLNAAQDSLPEIVVAVLDTGIYPDHEWFRGRIADGGTGFTFEYPGSTGNWDITGHGTHCAGIICSATPENVKILPVKCLDDTGKGTTLGVYCAMMYAAEQHADVVSMSLGFIGRSPLMEMASDILAEQDIPCVVAAGNDSQDAKYESIASIGSCITVSAIAHSTKDGVDKYDLASFSNFGSSIDFSAPGAKIESAGIDSPTETVYKSGTSMATPHVAACFANLLSYDPDLSVAEAYQYLKANAVDLGDEGFDNRFGWGMVRLTGLFGTGVCAAPTVDTPAGTYSEVLSVSLRTETADAVIYYTLDGSLPTAEHGLRYTGSAIEINQTTLLQAVAVSGDTASQVLRAQYILTCKPPTASPMGGAYDAAVDVKLESVHDGAKIYYTTDGSLPTAETGIEYDGTAIEMAQSAVLQAIAVIGETESELFYAEYCIGDLDVEDPFVVADGVLLSYRGVRDILDFSELEDLTAVGDHAFAGHTNLCSIKLPESVTQIGSAAFENCASLREITAKGVTEIGTAAFSGCRQLSNLQLGTLKQIPAYAFYRCSALRADATVFSAVTQIGDYAFYASKILQSNMIPWSQMTNIGDYAFYQATGMGELILSSVQSLGIYAFGDTNIGSVILPQTITVLPEGVFQKCNMLQSLSAPGVTRLEAYALDGCSAYLKTNIDFGALTEIGDYALSGYHFGDSVEFTSLTEIGINPFSKASADTMSFPLLTAIRTEAFHNIDTRILYFENVETVAEDAFRTDRSSTPGIVFGSKLTDIASGAFRDDVSYAFLAAPYDSILRQYAVQHRQHFRTTPDIYLMETEVTMQQYIAQSVEFYPLGFDMELQWYRRDHGEMTAVSGASDHHFTPDPMLQGDAEYCVSASIGGAEVASAGLTVHVLPTATSDQPMLTDSLNLIDWSAVNGREYAYHFTPETTGKYYILDMANAATVSVRYGADTILTGNKYFTASVRLQAGEHYVVVAELADDADISSTERYSLLRVVQNQSAKKLNSTASIVMRQSAYAYTGDVIRPAFTVQGENGQVLVQDQDYVVYYGNNTDAGEGYVYVFGIGAYTGMLMQEFQIYDTLLQEEARHTIRNLTTTGEYVQFQPAASDIYTIYLDYPLQELKNAVEIGSNIGDILDVFARLEVYDSAWQPIDESQIVSSTFMQLRVALDADETYFIHAYNATKPDTVLDLVVTARQTYINTDDTAVSYSSPLQFNGEYQDPVTAVTVDGVTLTAGTDYALYYFNHLAPGEMTAAIVGMGDYCGTIIRRIGIETDFWDAKDAATRIEPNAPFQMTGQYGLYKFTLEHNAEISFQKEDSLDTPFLAAIFVNWDLLFPSMELGWGKIATINADTIDSAGTLGVVAGEYYLAISQNEAAVRSFSLQTGALYLSDAEVFAEDVSYTGKSIQPHVTVRCRGKILQENRDYRLIYRGDYISCGTYEILVQGIGRYSGFAHAYFNIVSDSVVPSEQLTEGEHLAHIEQYGQTVCYRWVPEYETYCFTKADIRYCSIMVLDGEMHPVGSCEGLDFQYAEIAVVPGQTYTVAVSYLLPEQTGDIAFRVTSDYTLLADCTVIGAEAVPYRAQMDIPEYTVWDGDLCLTEGTDYAVQYATVTDTYGRAEIGLIGTGRYIGTQIYSYCIYPEDPADLGDEWIALEPDRPQHPTYQLPGYMIHFSFTSERIEDTTYLLSLPDALRQGISAFVYDSSGAILPMNTERVTLTQGESIEILCVYGWLSKDAYRGYEIGVFAETDAFDYYDAENGISYRFENGKAFVLDFDADAVGLFVPEQVTDPKTGISGVFSGFAVRDLDELRRHHTIYGQRDGLVDVFCRENALCFAATDSQSAVSGDVSGDGLVTQDDAYILQRWLTECRGMYMTDIAYAAADCNGDGAVDLLDVFAIMNICTQALTDEPEAAAA